MNTIQILLIRIILLIFKLLPERLCILLGIGIGLFWFHIVRYRRNLVFDNLRKAYKDEKTEKELYEIAKKNFIHYGISFAEFLRIPTMSKNDIHKKISYNGLEKIEKAKKKNKGIILICGHYGNGDFANIGQAIAGLNAHIITRRAKNESVDKFWQDIRKEKGVKFLPHKNTNFFNF